MVTLSRFAFCIATVSLATVVSFSQSNDQQLPSNPEPQAPSNPPAPPQVPRTAPSTATQPQQTPAPPPKTQDAQNAPIVPAAAERHYHAGRLFEKDQNYDNAIDEYRAAVEEYSDYVDARYRLANLLMNRQDYTDAVTQLRTVIMFKPSDANAHNDLGYALKKNGDAKGAASQYFAAIPLTTRLAIAPSNPVN